MSILIVLIVMIVGVLMYLLINRPEGAKVAEVGKIMFFAALLALMLGSGAFVEGMKSLGR